MAIIKSGVQMNSTALIDQHSVISLDLSTRKFTWPSDYNIVAVIGDSNSQKITFEVPKTYEGTNLSDTICVLSYWTSWTVDKVHSTGDIILEQVSEDELNLIMDKFPEAVRGEKRNNNVYYTWVLDNNQTANAGDVKFNLNFYSINEDLTYDHDKQYSFILVENGLAIYEDFNLIGVYEDYYSFGSINDKFTVVSDGITEENRFRLTDCATKAEDAAEEAREAAEEAREAADKANNEAKRAEVATTNADTAATNANKAVTDIQSLENSVVIAINNAQKATEEVREAAEDAREAADNVANLHENLIAGGYIESLKEMNQGLKFSTWIGTQEEYSELTEKENNRLYIITNEIPQADYIIEQGISGVWTYRKWASGIAECWCKMASVETPEWDTMSVVCSQTLPFEFIEQPIVNCSGGQFKTHGSYVTLTVGSETLVSAYIKCLHEIDAEHYCWFSFNVKGRWF